MSGLGRGVRERADALMDEGVGGKGVERRKGREMKRGVEARKERKAMTCKGNRRKRVKVGVEGGEGLFR